MNEDPESTFLWDINTRLLLSCSASHTDTAMDLMFSESSRGAEVSADPAGPWGSLLNPSLQNLPSPWELLKGDPNL